MGTRSALLLLLSLLFAPSAQAVTFYVESGMGTSFFRGGEAFFAPEGSSRTGYGLAFNLGFFMVLSDGSAPVELHFGLQPRYSTASQTSSYTLLAAYPVARLQISRLYVAGGMTPFVWRRMGASAGFDAISAVSSALATYGEVGILWPVTPDFSLGLAGTAQYVSSGGTRSPSPAVDLAMTMRFYLNWGKRGGDSGGASSGSNEFQGWRYPFGEIR
ncbi:MAG: hypothetical protein NDJ89_00785 [Oligoflexia bacterium]|nr:hypothetical protein [Oligoflexia bacterium]